MSPDAIDALFEALARERPEPRTELVYRDPFTLLVAVVLSAQATDVAVNKVTADLFAVADSPAKMVALGVEGVETRVERLGLYRNKAKNLVALSKRLLADHAGAVPGRREALEALPGVGRKTANVVLNEVFGEPTIAVDTHIFRVANRTGLAPGETPAEVERRLLEAVPTRWLQGAHHWLILHGRYTCTARKPRCASCVIREHCAWAAARAIP